MIYEKWTWRQRLANLLHQLAFKVDPPQYRFIALLDDNGDEKYTVSFEGGFVSGVDLSTGLTEVILDEVPGVTVKQYLIDQGDTWESWKQDA